jgi:Fibronectin type III domain
MTRRRNSIAWGQKAWKPWVCGVAIAIAAPVLAGGPAGAAKPPPTRPGVPSIVSVKAAPHGAIVTYARPVHDGGAPVRSAQVTCVSSNGGIKATQNGPRSPITVHGMSVGKSYTCRVTARNRIGVSDASAPSGVVLPIENPKAALPGAPTITYVHAGPQSIAVGYSPPADKGGSLITTYRAKCSSSNGGNRGAKEHFVKSPIVMDQLTAGKTYTCIVQARNSGGFGASSARSNSVVTFGLPQITTATGGVRSVTVAFKHPNVGPPLIISYEIMCTSSNGGVAGSQSADASPIRVRNLSAAKAYTCRLRVRNGAGVSSFSRPSKPVTSTGS